LKRKFNHSGTLTTNHSLNNLLQPETSILKDFIRTSKKLSEEDLLMIIT